MSEQDRLRNLANVHRRWQALRDAGVCTGCRTRPARPGHRQCEGCAQEENARTLERYYFMRAQGICVSCLSAPARPHRTRCACCHARQTAQRKAQQETTQHQEPTP